MPRPKRPRHIMSRPAVRRFAPEGFEAQEEILLSLEELEAIRLIDYQGMDQSQAAQIMNVSRQTVGRILKLGRYKLSKSIIEAARLTVGGGCYKISTGISGQGRCGHRKGRRGRGRNRME